jgi:hypothetical protein
MGIPPCSARMGGSVISISITPPQWPISSNVRPGQGFRCNPQSELAGVARGSSKFSFPAKFRRHWIVHLDQEPLVIASTLTLLYSPPANPPFHQAPDRRNEPSLVDRFPRRRFNKPEKMSPPAGAAGREKESNLARLLGSGTADCRVWDTRMADGANAVIFLS